MKKIAIIVVIILVVVVWVAFSQDKSLGGTLVSGTDTCTINDTASSTVHNLAAGTSEQLLSTTSRRIFANLENDSAFDVYLNIVGDHATNHAGIFLKATSTKTIHIDGVYWNGNIHAFSNGAAKILVTHCTNTN